MFLHQLIKSRKPLKLTHPQIGNVIWDVEFFGGLQSSYFTLQFAHGHEQFQPLVVDESIFLEDTWNVVEMFDFEIEKAVLQAEKKKS